ncbi:MAG TPA: zf-HC2 domain-containing protein, partial [Candidatus Baltobacteraceae bacterium]|nr:zf-HC2 domain-containing protein [Candidatus Baltobacteraceae bacterium]
MSSTHEAMLDDVAVYALGALPLGDAARVREHLASCESCAQEYHALTPAVAAVAATAEACPDAKHGDVFASPLLKARIMREVRRDAHEPAAPPRASRAIVWPAYLVAAACFAIAIVSSLVNLSLMEQLKSSQAQVARTHEASTSIARDLSTERATLADLTND